MDLLTHALLYTAKLALRKKIKQCCTMCVANCVLYFVASLICSRWKQANEMNEVAKQSFDSLCNSVSGIIWLHITSDTVLWNASPLVRVSESTLEDWIASRREVMTSEQKGQPGNDVLVVLLAADLIVMCGCFLSCFLSTEQPA